MSKIKNGGLDQYGAEPFEQQQFRTAAALKELTGYSIREFVDTYNYERFPRLVSAELQIMAPPLTVRTAGRHTRQDRVKIVCI